MSQSAAFHYVVENITILSILGPGKEFDLTRTRSLLFDLCIHFKKRNFLFVLS